MTIPIEERKMVVGFESKSQLKIAENEKKHIFFF